MLPWLSAFLVTQLIECPVYVQSMKGHSRPWLKAFTLSALTHPMVFFIVPTFHWGGYWPMVSMAEFFAVLVESVILSAFGVRYSLLWAFAANASSLVVGLGLRWAIGWP